MTQPSPLLRWRCGTAALALAAGACTHAPVQPIERAAARPLPAAPAADPGVTTTVVGGEAPTPALPLTTKPLAHGKGTIELNIPSADVRTLAQIVLRDTLAIPYTVAVTGDVDVGLSTPGPVGRAQLLGLFETALAKAQLAMVWQGSGYKIETTAEAKAEGSSFLADKGFTTETIALQFADAEQLKRLLDTIVPGVVEQVDGQRNTLVIAGTQTQRKSAHEIIAQFDVNWLRAMNFALYVPDHTDARLIEPELDKLINAPDAPTRGLVRLIAMDKLNGIIAITAQRQYLEDVRRWIEVLDREGVSSEPRLYVYRVQNGRARDLVRTINASFGFGSGGGGGATDPDSTRDSNGGTNPSATPPGLSPDGTQSVRTAPRNPLTGADTSAGTAGGGMSGGPKVRISADEVNNAVVVFGAAHDYAIVEDALRKLDIQPLQVLIEAAITEVTLTNELQYGVQWNYTNGNTSTSLNAAGSGSSSSSTSANNTTTTTVTTPTSTTVTVAPASQSTTTISAANLASNLASNVAGATGLSFFFDNHSNISAALKALEQRTNVKVVSAPKLLVLNNQTASLQVGDQVPITTASATSTVTNSSPIVNSVEYRDTGVILKVTPRVNASGTVLLDIAQEVSDVSNTTTSAINSPTISTRKIATTVAVQDGQIIALGGLFRDSRTTGKTGLPILSRIPVIGGLLFGQTSHTQNRTELIVLIKPHVLRNPDDLTAITEELRNKIQTVEPFKTKGKIP